MSLHYLVKYECQKIDGNLKYVFWLIINHKIAVKHLSSDGLFHYKFIIHCDSERTFKIGEHFKKLQAKWLIVSYAPFTLRLSSSKMQNSLDK